MQNKKNVNFSAWEEIKNKKNILFFDCFSKIDSIELLEASDSVVCWDSTLIETAAYRSKRPILLQNLMYKNLPIASLATNKKDLLNALKDPNPNLDLYRQSAIDFAYYRHKEGIPHKYINNKYEF